MENKIEPTAEEQKDLLESLYTEYFSSLVEYAQCHGCSPDLAEDLVQETFMVALEKTSELYNAPSRKGWLIRTLLYHIGNNRRSTQYAQKLMRMLEQQIKDPNGELLSLETLYHGLIREDDLKLLIGYWVKLESVKDLADERNLSEEACKKRIQRAKARFKQAFEKEIGNLN